MKIKLILNNDERVFEVEPGEMLVDVLRRYGFTSVRRGCDTGACGVCTVLLDGKPIPSCSTLAVRVENHHVTTVEGVQEEAERIGQFLTAEGVEQCGFCSPGFVLTSIAMKRQLKNPTLEDMKHFLVGNLCRCSGYEGHIRALKKYMEVE